MLSLGACKVIASLWSVDDKSTTLLMAMLYRNIVANKMSPERALGQAQNWLRSATLTELQATFPELFSDEEKQDSELGMSKPFAHPYYWASFVTIG
jgi:CHAT domain-containing protein